MGVSEMILNVYTEQPTYEPVTLPDYVPKTQFANGVNPFEDSHRAMMDRRTESAVIRTVMSAKRGVSPTRVARLAQCRLSTATRMLKGLLAVGRIQWARRGVGMQTLDMYYPPGVTLPAAPSSKTKTDLMREYIAAHPGQTAKEIAKGTQIKSAHAVIGQLKRAGEVCKEGPHGASRYYLEK